MGNSAVEVMKAPPHARLDGSELVNIGEPCVPNVRNNSTCTYVLVTANTGLERGEARVQFLRRHHSLFRASAQAGAITRMCCYFCYFSPQWLIGKTLSAN